MKFKEKMNQAAGFTLVELIVVIAILAILAGVAVPAYSGYITQANKSADQQLVNDIANALTLYYYSTMPENVLAVVGVDANGIKPDGTFASEALDAAGISQSSKLKWDGWTVGASQMVLQHFSDRADSTNSKYNGSLAGIYNGSDVPTFSEDIEDLFDMMQDVAGSIGGGDAGGADLVQGAAGITINSEKTAEDFADAWVNGTWKSDFFLGANSGEYNGDIDKDDPKYADAAGKQLLNNLIANAAVLKARNTVVAGYVREQLQENYPELPDATLAAVYNVFCNYNYVRNGAATVVPLDAATVLNNPNDYAGEAELLSTAIENAFTNTGASEYEVAIEDAAVYAMGYFSDANKEQAKTDALAYYAMMDTVNSHKESSGAVTDGYWNEMKDAVGLYASIVRGEVTLDDISNAYTNLKMGSNGIIVTLVVKNGELILTTNPSMN